ncbi:liprin-beta-1-like [Diadema antillarum]|uniref:liprin-beta-1-like n=1 Tax=Diadema antillarum TaxID=105358 RepID=UPI003A8B7888
MTNLASDASQMLAAALEQMDDIIAGTRLQSMDYENDVVVNENRVNITHPVENGSHADVPRLVDELRFAAERAIENGEENLLRDRIEDSTKQYIVRLLGDQRDMTDAASNEKIKRLESDKNSLQLQVNVLTDQIEVQNEKIQELELAVAKRGKELSAAETKLLQESEIHCELEQSQQNYAVEASQLKARLDAVENETLVVRERAIMAEANIEEKQQEMDQLHSKYQQSQKLIAELQAECHTWQEKYMETQALLDDLQTKQVRNLDEEVEKEKLKIAVDSLISGTKEKDKMIEELNRRLAKFYRVQELAAAQGRVDIGQLLDIENPRTDSTSTSSSATGETDTSRESRQNAQGSSPLTPEMDFKHAIMVDRTEDMFGANAGRRSASLENLQTQPHPSTNDPPSDSTLSSLTPDTNDLRPLSDKSPQSLEVLETPPTSEAERSPDPPAHSPDAADHSLPEDMLQLTAELTEVPPSDTQKTLPFPVHSHSPPDAVKKVNFNLDATTEIITDQRSSVGDDFCDLVEDEHVAAFLNQGLIARELANGNAANENGATDSNSDPNLTDSDDADVTPFRRDATNLPGHMTLPATKTADPETEIASRSNPSGYRTLPSPRRNQEFQLPLQNQQASASAHGSPETRKTRASFGKGLFKKGSKKTSSAPNLAMTESEGEDGLGVQRPRNVTFQSLERGGYPAPPGTPPLDYRRRKGGIKKLIGKLKRSGSATLNPEEEDEEVQVEFTRNSRLRATAGPRLAWSRDLKKNGSTDVNAPFAKWEGDQIADWLRNMGLSQYASACRVWVKNGGTLLTATPLDIEKYLGLKNPLHRKKLQLALQAVGSEQEDKPGELDYHWVTRWLDDVGLPQYKDTFLEARVDGRMLHYMTVDDLLLLKVTSAFHHTSIMRGVQCLRLNNFHPSCLRRRPTDEPWYKNLKNMPPWSNEMPYETGTQVTLWTNHRVMEWLRSVDLSEYAPNLRGSGVHGALMVLEPRFTAETLAAILCIPGNKTLLRRHLSTHFISLIGPDIQQQKREAEKQPTYMPLNFLAKVKPKKRTFGKQKRGTELDDYVCPMDLGHQPSMNGSNHVNGSRPPPPSYRVEVRRADMVHRQQDERAEGGEMQEGTAKKFGALSEEINSLTTMLSNSDMERSTHV